MLKLSLATVALSAAVMASATTPLPPVGRIKPVPVVITGDYTEGVVVDRAGALFFSHGKTVTRVAPDGRVSDWAETGAPNGHKVLPNGDHLLCDGSRKAVLRLSAEGKVLGTVATGKSGDLEIRTPNDLTLDLPGGFYFTDSVKSTGAVHYVSFDGTMRPVATGLNFPNGIVLSPDRKRLYVAESQENRVLMIPLKATGVPETEPRVFANLPRNQKKPGKEFNQPDGMALDQDGRLWVAHYGMKSIHVLSPQGKLLATYDGGNVTTSNLCFAGPANATLYATGGEPGGLFRLDLGVPGHRILPNP